MKTFLQVSAQGEITIDVVDRLPEDAVLKRIEPVDGKLIVSHSESGHHHYLPAADGELLERTNNVPAGMRVLYGIVRNPTALKQDATVPHDEVALNADTIYRYRISREYDPFQEMARRVAD